MMKDNSRYTTLIKKQTLQQQKLLCALAYLGKYYHTHISQEKLLKWIDTDNQNYRTMFTELTSNGWLVEELPHQGAVPILLVNPKRMMEILDFLLTDQQNWKTEIEGLVFNVSFFKLFENLVLAVFESDNLDDTAVLSRVCDMLEEDKSIGHEMLVLFRYYSHGEFNPVGGGNSAYTYILLGLRFMHVGDLDKASTMWNHALSLNGNQLFKNPLTLYFYMALNARVGQSGQKNLRLFLQSKHQQSLNAVPAILLAEYHLSKPHQPSFWKLDEYLRLGKQPYHRINLTIGLALARLFEYDVPLDIDSDLQPNHIILRHEFQCVQPLDPSEAKSLQVTYGKVAAFDHIPTASWQQNLNDLIELCKQGAGTSSAIKCRKARLIYLVNGTSISIRRQFCNTKGEWDICKRISPKEYSASMPEMDERDIAIYNRCKGNMLCIGLEDVLPFLVGSDRVFTGYLPPYKQVTVRNVQPTMIIEKDNEALQLTTNFPHSAFLTCGKTDFIIKQNDQRYDFIHISHTQERYLRGLLLHPELPLQAKDKLKYLVFQPNFPIVCMSSDLPGMNSYSLIKGSHDITIRITQRRNVDFSLSLVCYPLRGGSEAFSPGIGTKLYSDSNGEKWYSVLRDFAAELDAVQKTNATLSSICKHSICSIEDNITLQQLLDILSYWHSMKVKPFAIEWAKGASICVHNSNLGTNTLHLTLIDESWFRLRGRIRFDEDYYLDICDLLIALERKKICEYYKVDERTYIRLTEALKKQIESVKGIATKSNGMVLIPAVRVAELANMAGSIMRIETDEQFDNLQKRIRDSYTMRIDIPLGLNATLRSYQKDGFEWMARLDSWGAGACLADDMGLGKTVQTITMLLHKAKGGASLVVAPAAVMYNWADEISRFAPSLNPVILRDLSNREEVLKCLKPLDVLLVSYSMLVNMCEKLLPIQWNMVCLDEAHVIKSAHTEIARTVLQLKATTRLALTGTPLQNKAIDIWTIFQFLNPGLLGERSSFYSQYASTPQKMEQMRKFLSPFILRRTKKEVLQELPSKTEVIIRTEMSSQEAAVYEAVRQQAESAIRISNGNIKSVFSYIVKARMAACSASLLHPDIRVESSKLGKLVFLVKDLTAQGKKVLVFSQFVSFLELAKERLYDNGFSCLFYTGLQQAGLRKDIIQGFKSGSTQVLLLSLKAGGVGLNLTEACVVIHLDAWWNPAIENQATDRVYRIGQKQNVQVYHLIARNTVEENIVRLHYKKHNMAESILEGTDACLSMSADTLISLFKRQY